MSLIDNWLMFSGHIHEFVVWNIRIQPLTSQHTGDFQSRHITQVIYSPKDRLNPDYG
jgi:hypothetical protein